MFDPHDAGYYANVHAEYDLEMAIRAAKRTTEFWCRLGQPEPIKAPGLEFRLSRSLLKRAVEMERRRLRRDHQRERERISCG